MFSVFRSISLFIVAGVWRALKPDGRFVAECGGHGCIAKIERARTVAGPLPFPLNDPSRRDFMFARYGILAIAQAAAAHASTV